MIQNNNNDSNAEIVTYLQRDMIIAFTRNQDNCVEQNWQHVK